MFSATNRFSPPPPPLPLLLLSLSYTHISQHVTMLKFSIFLPSLRFSARIFRIGKLLSCLLVLLLLPSPSVRNSFSFSAPLSLICQTTFLSTCRGSSLGCVEPHEIAPQTIGSLPATADWFGPRGEMGEGRRKNGEEGDKSSVSDRAGRIKGAQEDGARLYRPGGMQINFWAALGRAEKSLKVCAPITSRRLDSDSICTSRVSPMPTPRNPEIWISR